MTAAVTAYFHLHHHHNIRNITNNNITAHLFIAHPEYCLRLLPCRFSCARLSPPEFGHMLFCHQLSFRPCFLPARIYTSSPLIPVWLRLSLSSFISTFITIIIFATPTTTPSPTFVHRYHCCLYAFLLAQSISRANLPNYYMTASISLTSLRLSPRSIRLVCQSPKFLYCFLCRLSRAQLLTSSTDAHAVPPSFVLSDPACLFISPSALLMPVSAAFISSSACSSVHHLPIFTLISVWL